MSKAQRGNGLLTSGVRAKETMIATMTKVTVLCRLPTMMDRIKLKYFTCMMTLIALLQEDMAAKTVITPASFLPSESFLFSDKYPERHRAKKIPSYMACCLLDIDTRAPCWCACEEKISFYLSNEYICTDLKIRYQVELRRTNMLQMQMHTVKRCWFFRNL